MIQIWKRKCPFGWFNNNNFTSKKKNYVGRKLPFSPEIKVYKPAGIPSKDLHYVELNLDEWEALRLKNIEELNQNESAKKMAISQSTFARILNSANKKVGKALINGCGIRILEK